MTIIIGTVKSVEGEFFAKDANQNILQLQSADVITEGMIVFGDKNNSTFAMIEISMINSTETVSLNGTLEQYFDTSLHSRDFEDGALLIENVIGQKGVLEALRDSI